MSKVTKKSKEQIGDQTIKGAIVAGLVYWGNKAGLPAELTASLTPVVLGFLAFISTKIGDNTTVVFKASE